ncbi:MAG TPA: thiamine pyrophosphate-dependent enzyme [Nitriliruptorales bacterium]|nr:thiamine pyrophosphate-dependent enzyme [Nitriliruptorales bacterium]
MSISRVEVVEANLDRCLRETRPAPRRLRPAEPITPGTSLTAGRALALFEDQVRSRVLDVVARELRAEGLGYYTISSAGHEDNAVLGALLRTTDPCFLHYRSGALMMARARQDGRVDPVMDTLLSLVASADDPIAQGRHKVWGSRRLWVPPQTSTIGSHLPKAVGAAFAVERARRLRLPLDVPHDSVVCCSFGDASVNHATALAAINAARYAQRRSSPVPLLFVCEDNGLGISVETPRRWVEASFGTLPHLRYVRAEGELDQVWDAVEEAVRHCRSTRAPVFVHLPVVRLLGHAGSDPEVGYRALEEIRADEARDPLVRNVRRLVETGAASPEELSAIVAATRERVRRLAANAVGRPKLATRREVMAPLAPYRPDRCRQDASRGAAADIRAASFGGHLPEDATAPARRTMAAHLNAALHDELLRRPELLVFGEDVGRKGGVYHVTAGLQRAFGARRVFDTLLDETTILGLAQGAALLGLLPVPEIQYLAYLHNALDQLRGEACSLRFFSSGQFTNPMVVRVAGLGYQKGFGGHFHNDDAIGALRDIPGLALAVPARGDDAARMLRGALAMAKVDGRVVCFLEPIALYHERDFHEQGDGGWLSDYPAPGTALLPGEVGVFGEHATEVLLVSYANGLRMSLRVARRLSHEHGISARVLDLRWLNPLPLRSVRAHADACGRVLVVDECRATGGGVADAIVSGLVERGYPRPVASVRSADSYVPLGPAADTVLLQEEEVRTAALDLVGR